MVDNINKLMSEYGISIDFDKDVLPISLVDDGGTITERHILFALSKKIIEKVEKESQSLSFLKKSYTFYFAKDRRVPSK